MSKRDFRTIFDFSSEEILHVFNLARELKREVPQKRFVRRLQDKVLAMIFEKPSLRTRCTFEIAITQMGGSAIYLGPGEIGLGKRESTYDIAKNLERWFDMVMIRTFAQKNVDDLGQYCSLPVINALSDEFHPCQAMADFLTILEKRESFDGFKLAYLGDGDNICQSLIDLTARLGCEIRVASPEAYHPHPERLARAREEAGKTGAKILITTDLAEAVEGVDAVYTDVWASMGQEQEAEIRKQVFQIYQLNAESIRGAKPDCWIMHDLPAHRGEEITDEMMDSPRSIVFDQAENRLHVQKAIMVYLDSLVTR
ncbi:MAG TPA: ornithine carbamoyltransferase [Candidatus Sumerlaeota bacterium]|nr:ornithine carbamoyltransferase [Candidatus Sumerlaeota bacterium]HPS01401.1 ornithine carbamoyltransferase [Candidatus Sumerlaeota bacterium]